jgi:hypothetical protein
VVWGIIGVMGAALDYGREKAPPDVLGLLDWLVGAGFSVVSELGGPGGIVGESAGAVLEARAGGARHARPGPVVDRACPGWW